MDKRQEAFDQACLSVITYLDTFEETSNVSFKGMSKATQNELDSWEKKNLPYKLPDDMRCFYTLFDGFSLTYGADLGGNPVAVGTLFLNSLSELKRVPIEGAFPSGQGLAGASLNSAGFSLDSSAAVGTMVLLYRGGGSSDGDSGTTAASAAAAEAVSDIEPAPLGGGRVPTKGAGDNSYENPEVGLSVCLFRVCLCVSVCVCVCFSAPPSVFLTYTNPPRPCIRPTPTPRCGSKTAPHVGIT